MKIMNLKSDKHNVLILRTGRSCCTIQFKIQTKRKYMQWILSQVLIKKKNSKSENSVTSSEVYYYSNVPDKYFKSGRSFLFVIYSEWI